MAKTVKIARIAVTSPTIPFSSLVNKSASIQSRSGESLELHCAVDGDRAYGRVLVLKPDANVSVAKTAPGGAVLTPVNLAKGSHISEWAFFCVNSKTGRGVMTKYSGDGGRRSMEQLFNKLHGAEFRRLRRRNKGGQLELGQEVAEAELDEDELNAARLPLKIGWFTSAEDFEKWQEKVDAIRKVRIEGRFQVESRQGWLSALASRQKGNALQDWTIMLDKNVSKDAVRRIRNERAADGSDDHRVKMLVKYTGRKSPVWIDLDSPVSPLSEHPYSTMKAKDIGPAEIDGCPAMTVLKAAYAQQLVWHSPNL